MFGASKKASGYRRMAWADVALETGCQYDALGQAFRHDGVCAWWVYVSACGCVSTLHEISMHSMVLMLLLLLVVLPALRGETFTSASGGRRTEVFKIL